MFIRVPIEDILSNRSDEVVCRFLEQLRDCVRKRFLTMASVAFVDLPAFNRGFPSYMELRNGHERPMDRLLGT